MNICRSSDLVMKSDIMLSVQSTTSESNSIKELGSITAEEIQRMMCERRQHLDPSVLLQQ